MAEKGKNQPRNKSVKKSTPAPKKRGIGRPSAYKYDFCDQARKLCLLGATDKQLADFFDVDESTINNWKVSHPEFLESIKAGKQQADANVADRLYQRALGYQAPDVDIKMHDGQIITTPLMKYYPPDTTAAIFWLKNRNPALWRDKTVQDHNHRFGLDSEEYTDEA